MNDRIASVIEAETNAFADLVEIAGLSPGNDFRGVDLSGVDFGIADLREYRFENTILDGADLSKTILTAEVLRGAFYEGAILPHNVPGMENVKVYFTLDVISADTTKSQFGTVADGVRAYLRVVHSLGPEFSRTVLYRGTATAALEILFPEQSIRRRYSVVLREIEYQSLMDIADVVQAAPAKALEILAFAAARATRKSRSRPRHRSETQLQAQVYNALKALRKSMARIVG